MNKLVYMFQLILFSQLGLIYVSHSQSYAPVCDSAKQGDVCLGRNNKNYINYKKDIYSFLTQNSNQSNSTNLSNENNNLTETDKLRVNLFNLNQKNELRNNSELYPYIREAIKGDDASYAKLEKKQKIKGALKNIAKKTSVGASAFGVGIGISNLLSINENLNLTSTQKDNLDSISAEFVAELIACKRYSNCPEPILKAYERVVNNSKEMTNDTSVFALSQTETGQQFMNKYEARKKVQSAIERDQLTKKIIKEITQPLKDIQNQNKLAEQKRNRYDPHQDLSNLGKDPRDKTIDLLNKYIAGNIDDNEEAEKVKAILGFKYYKNFNELSSDTKSNNKSAQQIVIEFKEKKKLEKKLDNFNANMQYASNSIQAVVEVIVALDMMEVLPEDFPTNEVIKLGTITAQGIEIANIAGSMLIKGALDPTGVTAIAQGVQVIVTLVLDIPSPHEIVMAELNQIQENQAQIFDKLIEMDSKLDDLKDELHTLKNALKDIKDIMKQNYKELVQNQEQILTQLEKIKTSMRTGFSYLAYKMDETEFQGIIRKLKEKQETYKNIRRLGFEEELKKDSEIIKHLDVLNNAKNYSNDLKNKSILKKFAFNTKPSTPEQAEVWLNTYLNQNQSQKINNLKAVLEWFNAQMSDIKTEGIKKLPQIGNPYYQDSLFIETVNFSSTLAIPPNFGTYYSQIDEICVNSQEVNEFSKILRDNLYKAYRLYLNKAEELVKAIQNYNSDFLNDEVNTIGVLTNKNLFKLPYNETSCPGSKYTKNKLFYHDHHNRDSSYDAEHDRWIKDYYYSYEPTYIDDRWIKGYHDVSQCLKTHYNQASSALEGLNLLLRYYYLSLSFPLDSYPVNDLSLDKKMFLNIESTMEAITLKFPDQNKVWKNPVLLVLNWFNEKEYRVAVNFSSAYQIWGYDLELREDVYLGLSPALELYPNPKNYRHHHQLVDIRIVSVPTREEFKYNILVPMEKEDIINGIKEVKGTKKVEGIKSKLISKTESYYRDLFEPSKSEWIDLLKAKMLFETFAELAYGKGTLNNYLLLSKLKKEVNRQYPSFDIFKGDITQSAIKEHRSFIEGLIYDDDTVLDKSSFPTEYDLGIPLGIGFPKERLEALALVSQYKHLAPQNCSLLENFIEAKKPFSSSE